MKNEKIDYKALYFKLFRATEDVIQGLIRVQQECEELYLSYEEDRNEAQ